MTELHVCTIPLGRLAWCEDCKIAFDVTHGACPNCATTCGWAVIPWGDPQKYRRLIEEKGNAEEGDPGRVMRLALTIGPAK